MPDDLASRRIRSENALLIAVAMLATFIPQRLYLHLINSNADLYIAGYNIHHLFTGVLIEFPAAVVLALGIGGIWTRRIACVAFGSGMAMVLDEVVFLIATDGSNQAYLTPVSLWGVITLVAMALLFISAFYGSNESAK